MKNIRNIISIAIVCVFLLNITVFGAQTNQDLSGIDNSKEVLSNISFTDIDGSSSWAKPAICEMAGLSIIKGYGDKTYKPGNSVTKLEAITLIYRALGKEAEAQKEGQKLEDARSVEEKKKDSQKVWADGYLSLAQKDGLITQDEYDMAVNPAMFLFDNKNGYNADSFISRQETANWLAKAFKLEPIYSQDYIFNNYKDWKKIDQEKIPYIEAILKGKIMNGHDGYFYPQNPIRRDEFAQVLKNSEDYILKANSYNKKAGFVENIIQSNDNNKSIKSVLVRGFDGSALTINLEGSGKKTDLVIYKNGKLGNSQILSKDDELEVIYDKDNRVKYINVTANKNDGATYYGYIESIDADSNKVTFNSDNLSYTMPVSTGGIITVNNEGKELGDLPYGEKAYFTVMHNIITRIEVSNTRDDNDPQYYYGEKDARGIVGESNSNLNYLSLYSLDGKTDAKLLRTFNFGPKTQITKDGVKSDIRSIEVGDTVYIKFNEKYGIEYINVETNYFTVYGEILGKGKNYIIVKKENGETEQLSIDDSTLVVKTGVTTNLDDLAVGDVAKLTINRSDKASKVKGIRVEGDQSNISNIYKGKLYSVSKDKIMVLGLKYFGKGKWVDTAKRGINSFNLDDECRIYYNGNAINGDKLYNLFKNKYIYFASYADYGNEEKVIKIYGETGFEKIYNNEVSQIQGDKKIQLSNSTDSIKFTDGSIITKLGKLTTGQNVALKDPVYIVGIRSAITGDINASIIQVVEKPSVYGIDIYRGKISSIDEGKSFTVESFSILKGINWEFVNTQKTFDLSNQTRIVDSGGIINNREFIDYTDTSYKDTIVYIAATGTQACLISIQNYGIVNLKGEIYNVSTTSTSSAQKVSLKLKDSSVYNSTTGVWDSIGVSTIDALVNSIVIKNKKICTQEDLAVGDKVRVIKKDNTSLGSAFIILVEE